MCLSCLCPGGHIGLKSVMQSWHPHHRRSHAVGPREAATSLHRSQRASSRHQHCRLSWSFNSLLSLWQIDLKLDL